MEAVVAQVGLRHHCTISILSTSHQQQRDNLALSSAGCCFREIHLAFLVIWAFKLAGQAHREVDELKRVLAAREESDAKALAFRPLIDLTLKFKFGFAKPHGRLFAPLLPVSFVIPPIPQSKPWSIGSTR